MIYQAIFESPIGLIRSLANDEGIFYLGFIEGESVEIQTILEDAQKTNNSHLINVEDELQKYFAGTLKAFNTKIILTGTNFQKVVWEGLKNINYGKIVSYQELAIKIGYPNAVRALGNANGKNPVAIIVPCHRVVRKNKTQGGYAWGVERKRWLLTHEEKFLK